MSRHYRTTLRLRSILMSSNSSIFILILMIKRSGKRRRMKKRKIKLRLIRLSRWNRNLEARHLLTILGRSKRRAISCRNLIRSLAKINRVWRLKIRRTVNQLIALTRKIQKICSKIWSLKSKILSMLTHYIPKS